VPDTLWPPNHRLVPVSIRGVTGPDDATTTLQITGVRQDEPVNGLGDGDTSPDAVIQTDRVLLRAGRSGTGNGRVYHVYFRAADGQGGSCQGEVTVGVPHDSKRAPIDGGSLNDSTAR